jgi:hypothetical protein
LDIFKMTTWQWTCESTNPVTVEEQPKETPSRRGTSTIPWLTPPPSNPGRYSWAAALTEFMAISVVYMKIFQSWKNFWNLSWPN